VRGILDGHLVLSRKLAHENHWPAIDSLASISRSMNDVVTSEQTESAALLRRILAAWKESQDLVSIGAYRAGTNPLVDTALQLSEPIRQFLTQDRLENSTLEQTQQALTALTQAAIQLLQNSQRVMPQATSQMR
jgi:flagellum-specific ATP synthase